ncbi:flavin reductase family protein [Prolixibacteraceae bacterium]|nr:flavin reductase family protein [Prolixibacteraceae bacterium]
MGKVNWKPGNMIYPLPAALVSCGWTPENYNLITISWTGTVCTNPPMAYISVRPERHSYDLIKESGEFVINVTTKEIAKETDWCGVKSGRDFDKFKETGLTPIAATVVKAPLIEEAPISIECRVKEIVSLGSHDMFIADVVNVVADDKYLDPVTGSFDLSQSNPLAYSHGHYFTIGEPLGRFGHSVQKKKNTKKKKK